MINSNIICFLVAIATLVILVTLITLSSCQDTNLADKVCLHCTCEGPRVDPYDPCGIYRITWEYSPDTEITVNRATPEWPTTFENCALTDDCENQTVKNYLQTFKEDCNGTNKMRHCYHYPTVRYLAGNNCPDRYFDRKRRILKQCLLPFNPNVTYELYSWKKYTTQATPKSDIKPANNISEETPQTFTEQQQKNVTEIIQIPQNEDSIQNSITIPPLSVFELVRGKETSESNKNATKETNGSQLERRPIESSKDLSSNKMEHMVKSKTVDWGENLRKQNVFLEAFLNSTRVEKEKHEVFKNIAENIKRTDGADDTKLKIQTIENKQSQFVNIFQRIDKFQIDHNKQVDDIQTKHQEVDEQINRIAEERRDILKEISRNIKNTDIEGSKEPSTGAAPQTEDTSVSVPQFPVVFKTASQLESETNKVLGNGTNRSHLKGQTIESSKDLISNKMDQETLRKQDVILEAFLNSTRVENEKYEVLKNIAENIKHTVIDGADDVELKIQTIEGKQKLFFTILQRINVDQNDHNKKNDDIKKTQLEVNQHKNRLAKERIEILKEIAKNINHTDEVSGTHFL